MGHAGVAASLVQMPEEGVTHDKVLMLRWRCIAVVEVAAAEAVGLAPGHALRLMRGGNLRLTYMSRLLAGNIWKELGADACECPEFDVGKAPESAT